MPGGTGTTSIGAPPNGTALVDQALSSPSSGGIIFVGINYRMGWAGFLGAEQLRSLDTRRPTTRTRRRASARNTARNRRAGSPGTPLAGTSFPGEEPADSEQVPSTAVSMASASTTNIDEATKAGAKKEVVEKDVTIDEAPQIVK